VDHTPRVCSADRRAYTYQFRNVQEEKTSEVRLTVASVQPASNSGMLVTLDGKMERSSVRGSEAIRMDA
jgi:hypothetical protein